MATHSGRAISQWCDCGDAPLYARGPATFLDHPDGCEFPVGVCSPPRRHRGVAAVCPRRTRRSWPTGAGIIANARSGASPS